MSSDRDWLPTYQDLQRALIGGTAKSAHAVIGMRISSPHGVTLRVEEVSWTSDGYGLSIRCRAEAPLHYVMNTITIGDGEVPFPFPLMFDPNAAWVV